MKQILDIFIAILLGAFGALVRLIHTNPSSITFIAIIFEMIMGGFVGIMTWITLSAFTSYEPLTISAWAGVMGIMSREVVTILIKKIKKEADNKYGVKIKK